MTLSCKISLALIFSIGFGHIIKAQSNISTEVDSVKYYTVKHGDTLSKLARDHFDKVEAWDLLYKLNKEMIDNPDLIYPGQMLKIPVSKKTFTEGIALNTENTGDTTDNKKKMLEKFRSAFNKVVSNNTPEKSEAKQQEENFRRLNAGGMILDESRSKMGSDFYNIFYTNWESPNEQFSFTITISERPTPSLGTVVLVKVDGQNVFQNRLEPRFHKIELAAKNAIQVCQRYLKIKMLKNDPYHGI